MEHNDINTIYNQISHILKNDQKYSYAVIGSRIVGCTTVRSDIEQYFNRYPPLLDIAELGASLEHEGSAFERELMEQIQYKMQQLRAELPETP